MREQDGDDDGGGALREGCGPEAPIWMAYPSSNFHAS